jgi:hypothetical protein
MLGVNPIGVYKDRIVFNHADNQVWKIKSNLKYKTQNPIIASTNVG